MKKQLFILTVFCIALFSCKNNNDVESIVTVKLNPSFITLNEGNNEPMNVKSNGLMKMNSVVSATDSVVYAIQVYENDAPYYYGLFNDVSKMQLALTTSKTYKFKVSAYKVGTGKWLKSVIDTAGTNYFLPTKTPLKNKFIKGDILKDIDLASSAVLNNQTKIYPEVDAFYATKSLTLDKGTTSIDFTLLRMGFGINFTVDAITSGAMEIYVGNDTLKLNSTKTSTFTVRQFSTALNSFGNIYSNATTFGDSIAVSAKWISGSGTTVTATGKYKFLRNYQKTINVQLNTLTNNVTFEPWKIPTDGLIAYYPFNGNANDESGNGNNGTVSGATLITDRFESSNSAYYFSGANSLTRIDAQINTSSINNSHEYSLSIWIKKIGNGSTQPRILEFFSNTNGALQLNWDVAGTNFIEVETINSTGVFQATSYYSTIWLNNWNNIVFTAKTGLAKLYLNGVLVNSFTFNGLPSLATNVSFGRMNHPAYNAINGALDDIGIWNRVLTQDEITSLYNAK